jgi:hypothetical protein
MGCKACQEGKICPKCINKLSKPVIAPAPPAVATKTTDTKQEQPKQSLWKRFKVGFIKAAENYQKSMAEQEKRSKGKGKGKGKKSNDSWGWDFDWSFDWEDLGLEPPSSSTKRRRKKNKGYRLELGGWGWY